MEKAFNQNINKGLTVKKAYNQVAKAFGLDSSRAVKQALYRHKKRNK
jgi:post-segregation antitoxin (ccd killing protein)